MNQYQKPLIYLTFLNVQGKLASLSQWLSENELTDAGITTYVINS